MRELKNGKNIKDSCTTTKIYEVFKNWCKDNNGGYTATKQEFNKELMQKFNAKDIKDIQSKINGNRYYIFTLTTDTKNEYHVVDSVATD